MKAWENLIKNLPTNMRSYANYWNGHDNNFFKILGFKEANSKSLLTTATKNILNCNSWFNNIYCCQQALTLIFQRPIEIKICFYVNERSFNNIKESWSILPHIMFHICLMEDRLLFLGIKVIWESNQNLVLPAFIYI